MKGTAELRRAKATVRERSGGVCEIRVPSVCTHRAVHVHHCLRGNPRVHDPEAMLDTCFECHEHVHRETAEAYERGWLRHRSAS